MALLAGDIEGALNDCDVVWMVPNAVFSAAEKLTKVVRVAVAIFVYFLEIHPYANGNGHAARFILIAALARHGIFLRRWQLHPRPQDPPYNDAIAEYRSGNRGLLERFVLSCI
jgi:fido (protein-threonine AMPylation protein)